MNGRYRQAWRLEWAQLFFFSFGQARKVEIAVLWQVAPRITELSRGAYATRERYISLALGRGGLRASFALLEVVRSPKVAVGGSALRNLLSFPGSKYLVSRDL